MNWKTRLIVEAATIAVVAFKPIDLAAGVIIYAVKFPEELLAFRKEVVRYVENGYVR